MGLYSVPSIDAGMLVTVIKAVLLRLNLSFHRVHGQCYDGASIMSGKQNSVAMFRRSLIPMCLIASFCISGLV